MNDRVHVVGELIGELVDIWRSRQHPYPEPVGQYANLLDAYMQRIKLGKRRYFDLRSTDIDAALGFVRQSLSLAPDDNHYQQHQDLIGDFPSLAGPTRNSSTYLNQHHYVQTPYLAQTSSSTFLPTTSELYPDLTTLTPNSSTSASLPLADWASKIENGMDGLPSLAAFFTNLDRWDSATFPMYDDSNFSSQLA